MESPGSKAFLEGTEPAESHYYLEQEISIESSPGEEHERQGAHWL